MRLTRAACTILKVTRLYLSLLRLNSNGLHALGGSCDFAMQFKDFMEHNDGEDDAATVAAVSPSSSTTPTSSRCASPSAQGKCRLPILSGLRMPTFAMCKPVNPLFSSIRQNMDLIGGVGEPIPIRVPDDCTPTKMSMLPQWLQDVISTNDGAARVADRFLEIEQAEKRRLESAFSSACTISKPCSISNAFSSITGKVLTPAATIPDTPAVEMESSIKSPCEFSIMAALERGVKNRYNNIFPYDHTRVKLSCAPGNCDYINASYISPHGSIKRYIATQGPLPDTFADFWSVVWDQDVRVILMLTPVQEGGQVKCHSYWQPSVYGKVLLTIKSENDVVLSEKTGTKVRVREFALSNVNNKAAGDRVVIHIQYASWPDLGEPADPIDLVSLSGLTSKYNNEDANITCSQHPIIVHCSAGCGRTGTFCTVDSAIDIMQRNSSVMSKTQDLIADLVNELRTQRLSMVQCLRQFVICYESVLVWKVQQISQKMKENNSEVEEPMAALAM